jgi:hypothetical protein
VAYLNGSKVLTTGSALTFDGTNLGVGTSSPGYKLDVIQDANSFTGARFRNNDSGSSAYSGVAVNAFGNSWAMRMGSTAANSNALQFVQDALGTPVVRATLDTSGNLGLGVTPSAWTTFKVLQSGQTAYASNGTVALFYGNTYYDGTERYITTGTAARFDVNNTSSQPFRWYTAGSGTAGNAITFTQTMTLDASGNLGIGTTSPAAKLDISGTDSTCQAIIMRRGIKPTISNLQASILCEINGIGSAESMTFMADAGYKWLDDAGTTEWMRLDSSGNLGLGVTPSAWGNSKAIQVGGGSIWNSGGAGNIFAGANYYFDGTNRRYIANGFATEYLGNGADGKHIWYNAPSGTAGNAITFTQAMTLDVSGNLQIGSTSYAYRVAASRASDGIVGYFRRDGATVNPALTISCNETGNTVGFGTDYAGATSPAITFSTQGTERARITSGGKMLVGTTSTSGTLTVDGVDAVSTGSVSTYAITCGNDAADALAFGSDASFAFMQSFGSRALVINLQGNEVRVAGSTDQGAYNLQVNGTGVWGAGAYVNGSDERLKKDIATIDAALDVVTSLRPVTFRYKEAYSKDQSIQPGFIAQELQAAMAGKSYLGGIVQEGPQHLNVAYQSLIPLLTKAIQEQQALIQTLTARIAALEAK